MDLRTLVAVTVISLGTVSAYAAGSVRVWTSSQDLQCALTPGDALTFAPDQASDIVTFTIEPDKTYQTILGMGSSLEHTTCYNISLLDAAKQAEVIEKLFDPEKGIGMNLVRICIGTSDFAPLPYYSYDDMPEGETDPALEHFSIEKDRAYILPVLKMALAQNPKLLFLASPWSPPGWMKRGGGLCGGTLLEECYGVYAQYLAKFVKAYEAEGIPIHALTLQNEPGMVHKDYPTSLWNGDKQRDFIKNHLGPVFKEQGIAAKIWCFDHNFNNLKFPQAVLSDPDAAQYVDGTAFHFYEGKPEAMTELHEQFPDKHIYFTEGSTFQTTGALKLMTFFRNWAESYNSWVTVLDENHGPNSGPHGASATCIMLDTAAKSLEYRFDYYMYGQFMKFIQRGAVRIASNEGGRDLSNIAFKNPDGSIVTVVVNRRDKTEFKILCGGQSVTTAIPAKSVATYVWTP
ncbi:MAG: hypothetical protein QG656_2429 [Candidatus Hydrogenedentes bacterium]|nr:hypothetical protein [Candidatus Hydrogenedentota bacterium]